jgi:tRNA dimethylallyltransferase
LTGPVSKRVLCVVGPTASGKSQLAFEIARLADGELVLADSRQIYRFMSVGTAKPGMQEREAIPHHLVDIVTPDSAFSAGEYGRMARLSIQGIFSRNRLPVVVGGSGLYIRALSDGLFDGLYRDEAVRIRLRRLLADEGSEALHMRLAEADPDAAEKIHPNDEKRVLRALEVITVSGKPITTVQKQETRPADFEAGFYGLEWPRDVLYNRIDARVDHMIQSGLLKEVNALVEKGYHSGNPGLDSVGYRETLAHIRGDISYQHMVQLIKMNTRRYAKRQMTWFRRDTRIRWLPVSEEPDWTTLAEEVLSDFQNLPPEIHPISQNPGSRTEDQ